MSKEKCCGNCKQFKNEDADGYGWCELQQEEVTCAYTYPCHEPLNNGWTELTPDYVDLIYSDRVVVTDGKEYKMGHHWHASLSTLAKVGGYYYYDLPELKK